MNKTTFNSRFTFHKVICGLRRQFNSKTLRVHDHLRGLLIRVSDSWPCPKSQILIVGCESSGTTIISKLLFCSGNGRFLKEGHERWVWRAYMSIYAGDAKISDFPRLQLFDYIKVPGFASILGVYKEAFPNVRIVYVLRDPRDVLASTYRTFKLTSREELSAVSWVKQDWLNIKSRDPVERLATRWSIYLKESVQVDGVCFVKYEDFCKAKIASAKSLCQVLSLPFNEEVAFHLAEQQASHSSVRDYLPVAPGSWKNSPFVSSDDEAIVTNICGDQMREFGYSY